MITIILIIIFLGEKNHSKTSVTIKPQTGWKKLAAGSFGEGGQLKMVKTSCQELWELDLHVKPEPALKS